MRPIVFRPPRSRPALVGLGVALVLTALAACAAPGRAEPGPAGTRLTDIGERCPAELSRIHDHAPTTTSSASLLPDPVHVAGAVVCEYTSPLGSGADRGRLGRRVVLSAARARPLAAAIHAVQVVALRGPVSCPADFGTATVISIRTSAASGPIDLLWRTSGCESLDDGVIGTTQLGNPSFEGFLQAFARAVPPADRSTTPSGHPTN